MVTLLFILDLSGFPRINLLLGTFNLLNQEAEGRSKLPDVYLNLLVKLRLCNTAVSPELVLTVNFVELILEFQLKLDIEQRWASLSDITILEIWQIKELLMRIQPGDVFNGQVSDEEWVLVHCLVVVQSNCKWRRMVINSNLDHLVSEVHAASHLLC